MTQAKLMAGLFLILAVLASYFAIYRYGRHVEFLKQDNLRKTAIIQATKENDALKSKLEEDHAQATAALNVLLNTHAPRVRLPVCPSGESNPTGGGQVPAPQSERTRLGSQELLDEAGRHLESKAVEWSRAIEACRVVMEWSRAQSP